MSTDDGNEPSHDERNITTAVSDRCPECGGAVRPASGEWSCDDCGLVTSAAVLDRGPEWRRFDDDDDGADRVRTGGPVTPTFHDRGVSAEIGRDAVESGRKRRQLYRLRREHGRARFRSKAERNLGMALGEIARLASAVDLPRTAHERAAVVYRQAHREGLPTGRSIDALAAASVYAACRCGGFVRSVDEVGSVARCETEAVARNYRLLNRELGLAPPPVRPGAFVAKLAAVVDAPDAVRRRAFELVSRAEAAGLATGRHPAGLAAAGVYHAGHEHGQFYLQSELAEHAGVTPATVRKRRAELQEHVD